MLLKKMMGLIVLCAAANVAAQDTAPIISYDHIAHQWTIPLNFTFGKTVIWNSRPWKLGAEINYFVDQPDAFGPSWFIGFNVAPVVENVMANWFK